MLTGGVKGHWASPPAAAPTPAALTCFRPCREPRPLARKLALWRRLTASVCLAGHGRQEARC